MVDAEDFEIPFEIRNKIIFVGNNNKMILFDINEKIWEQVQVTFSSKETVNTKIKPTNIFKNFGQCLLFEKKLFYSGGGTFFKYI